jgi:hypothetical protein
MGNALKLIWFELNPQVRETGLKLHTVNINRFNKLALTSECVCIHSVMFGVRRNVCYTGS